MAKKERLEGNMGEDGLLAGSAAGESIISSGIVSATVETKLPSATRGRPKTKPSSKAVIFHLPLDLIAQIDAEAEKITTGNKSAFAVRVFSEYFVAK